MKLKFWDKHESSLPSISNDPMKFGTDSPAENNLFNEPSQPKQYNPPAFEQPVQPIQQFQNTQTNLEKDLSLINAKLDAIKAEIAHMHQRIQKIERIADESQTPQVKKPETQYRW